MPVEKVMARRCCLTHTSGFLLESTTDFSLQSRQHPPIFSEHQNVRAIELVYSVTTTLLKTEPCNVQNSQMGCHHLSPQLSSAVHHGQQQQRSLWGTHFRPLQCSGEVAGSLERHGSPQEFPGYTAAFSGHKPTSLTQQGYGRTAGVLLSAAVTLMHR